MSTIKCGDIVRMELTQKEGITPKNTGDKARNKYFIVLGKTTDGKIIGFVVINTNINNNLSDILQQLHYPLSSDRYPFLEKTRYAYCGEVKQICFTDFSDRQCSIFGKIEDEDLKLIKEALLSSPIAEEKMLKKFGLNK